jgi:hypothetical protein
LSSSRYLFFLFILLAFLTGCQKKAPDQEPVTIKPFNNYDTLLNEVKGLFHTDDGIVLPGNFKGDNTQQAAALIYVNKKEEKINFNLIEIKDNKLEKKDETKPLDGSLKGCKLEKINLQGMNNDLIYYNSEGYFMGSSDGEVYAYIIDFKTPKTYYAHLVSQSRRPVQLYISDTENKVISKYFIDSFKKDYPTIKLTARDPVFN